MRVSNDRIYILGELSPHVPRGVEQPGDGRHLLARPFTGEVSPSRWDSCKQSRGKVSEHLLSKTSSFQPKWENWM